jgi:8-oxo-dGTP pyrophosphatase MutT (NUDIX family)
MYQKNNNYVKMYLNKQEKVHIMSDQEHSENRKITGRWGNNAVGAIIFDPYDNTFVLSMRSAGVMEPLTYGTIGGAIDPEEDTATALNRELEEELESPSTYKYQKLLVFNEPKFKYENFIAISLQPFNIDDCTLNWENDFLEKRKIEDWLKERNLHFGVKALFKDKKSVEILNEWAGFSLDDSLKKLEKIKSVIGRLNIEIPKHQEEKVDNEHSEPKIKSKKEEEELEKKADILNFLTKTKSKKFKEMNKLRAKVNKFNSK